MQYLLTQEELDKLKGETSEVEKMALERVKKVLERLHAVFDKHGAYSGNQELIRDLREAVNPTIRVVK